MGNYCELTVLTDDDAFFEQAEHMSEENEFAEPYIKRQISDDATQECQLTIVWVVLLIRTHRCQRTYLGGTKIISFGNSEHLPNVMVLNESQFIPPT